MGVYTNTNRLTGLSGFDTEGMVQQLMKAESMKYDKLYQQRELAKYKQSAYQGVTKSLQTFQNTFLSFTSNTSKNIRSTANWQGLTPTVKNAAGDVSKAVSVKASTGTAGSYSLHVTQIAKNEVYKSGSLPQTVTGTAINVIDIQAGDTIKFSLDGAASKTIEFTAQDVTDIQAASNNEQKLANLLNDKLKTAFGEETKNGTPAQKVKASLDSSNHLVITAGEGHSVSFSSGAKQGTKANVTSSITGLSSAGGTLDFTVQVGTDSYDITASFNGGETLEDATKILNEALKKATQGGNPTEVTVPGISFSYDSSGAGSISVSNGNGDKKAQLSGGITSASLNESSSLTAMGLNVSKQSTGLDLNAKIVDAFDSPLLNASFTIGSGTTKTFTVDQNMTINDLMKAVNEANVGAKMSFNATKQEFTLESTQTGASNGLNLQADPAFMTMFGGSGNASHQAAQDAIFELNGVSTTRETNNFTMDGLTIGLTAEAENKDFDITIASDPTAVSGMVKNFIDEYNKLITDLTKQVNTGRTTYGKGTYYEPLTEAQRKGMSEYEIKNWDEQAKTGMLYRDQTVRDILSNLRTNLYEPVTLSDGSKLSLFQLGITSANDGRGGVGTLAFDEAKFAEALEKYGDKVGEFFTKSADSGLKGKAKLNGEGFAERVNDLINNAIGKSGTLYKLAGEEGLNVTTDYSEKIKKQDDKIAEMLDYLARQENKYYMQFSKLESAMNQQSQQMSALYGMLGIAQ